MKCFNCGNSNSFYLCDKCLNNDIIENTINKLLSYKSDCSVNEYIKEYIESIDDYKDRFDCIPKLLENYTGERKEYFYCKYLRKKGDKFFENAAIEYLETHQNLNSETQIIICDLLYSYLRNDFEKPSKWCDIILNSDNLYIELYNVAAEFYSMIGEYDKSETLIKKAQKKLETETCNFIFSNNENMKKSFSKIENLLNRYKNGNPYWPVTEERQKIISDIYEKKGIQYKHLIKEGPSLKQRRIKESDFKPIKESFDYKTRSYCSFWCEHIEFNGINDIYQIAAIKVVDDKIVDKFEEYIRPWDGNKYIEMAAKKAGIDKSVLEKSSTVDIVINKFKEFVNNDVLISTGALGNQLKYLIRAYRWASQDCIENEILDLLDFAADAHKQFDMENNNRQFILDFFNIKDSDNALSKAENNIILLNKLRELSQNEFDK